MLRTHLMEYSGATARAAYPITPAMRLASLSGQGIPFSGLELTVTSKNTLNRPLHSAGKFVALRVLRCVQLINFT